MANISVKMTTNEYDGEKPFKQGYYEIKIVAGLDEELDNVIAEASERARVLLGTLPVEKRYPRFSES